ncbi:hypothetical protein D1007_44891 [Hordeum vulgare]|nr:hypothetical protein D1007_44891 [Hordeum vulgare]
MCSSPPPTTAAPVIHDRRSLYRASPNPSRTLPGDIPDLACVIFVEANTVLGVIRRRFRRPRLLTTPLGPSTRVVAPQGPSPRRLIPHCAPCLWSRPPCCDPTLTPLMLLLRRPS